MRATPKVQLVRHRGAVLLISGTEGKVFKKVLEEWLLEAGQGWLHSSSPAGMPDDREVDQTRDPEVLAWVSGVHVPPSQP